MSGHGKAGLFVDRDVEEVEIAVAHFHSYYRARTPSSGDRRVRFPDQADEVRNLYCVVDIMDVFTPEHRLRVPTADAARWSASTKALLLAIETANSALNQAVVPLRAPRRLVERALWRLRAKRFVAAYESTKERIDNDLLRAFRDFRAQMSDLPAHLEAGQARETRERQERATLLANGLDESAWGYYLDTADGERTMSIFLRSLDPAERSSWVSAPVETGLALEQILSAVAEELSNHRETFVSWEPHTDQALNEHSSHGWPHYIAARLMAMATEPDAAMWAYTVTESSRARWFEIQLLLDSTSAIEPQSQLEGEAGITLDHVQAALAEERTHHPSTIAAWDSDTSQVLKTWHGCSSPEDAWQALTGKSIVTYPPQQKPSRHSHGPSTNYADGSHSSGFDTGGHSGSFGTSF
ncbi:hypothetical protein [Sphaerisporangium aureirubrum]|uniref:DUF2786 domain-containing protein n=1 Tax=Sphaerisporangium aureirubrum TaxID=1544736 RepID=A0ABW1NIY5_9ACTN